MIEVEPFLVINVYSMSNHKFVFSSTSFLILNTLKPVAKYFYSNLYQN